MQIRILDGDKRRMLIEEELLNPCDGRDEDGYNIWGYDSEGRDRRGFDYFGIHRETNDYFDLDGLDEYKFDKKGIAQTTSCLEWELCCEFSSVGIHKVTKTNYNELGVDWKGYNREGIFIGDYECLELQKNILKLEQEINKKCQQLNPLKQWDLQEESTKEKQRLLGKIEELKQQENLEEVKSKINQEIEVLQLEKKKNAPPSKFMLKRPERREKATILNKISYALEKKKEELEELEKNEIFDKNLLSEKRWIERCLDSLERNPEEYFAQKIAEKDDLIVDLEKKIGSLSKEHETLKDNLGIKQKKIKIWIQSIFSS